MKIKILGPGCYRCNELEKVVKDAAKDISADITVIKEEDMNKILGYGIARTPALVINEKVIMSGRIPDTNEIKKILIEYM